ncbi:uncharacterized protein At3g60930, chloroplastic-like [Arabidopsis lyrata subsp. lyrata]|uniref:uncharacterized protein At3g60930, chloroplastic-like n=1 Tax=Arabidopsis lyrata subsp. lyrata TaxID=81972 RepID=UPI000A29C41F|nr:uncharacterized protein At3g60930, chloroplastic-like [Arabidopsis lyrata subsp. lyrata]|eukprot:XP_020871379.1 uncharacterized protein At3g60930, chloroplastic-like [Arabidopsis lyrata subsp. lyrata]
MSSPAVYVSNNEGIPIPRGDEVFTQRGDKFGPHFRSQSTSASLGALRRLCNIPQEIEFSLPRPNESPKVVREGYCCAYEVYFKGCGLFFPIPEVLLLYLLHLGIAFPQMAPNFLRYVLSTLTVSAEAGSSLSTSELLGLFRARESAATGIFSINPILDRNLIDGMPSNDGPWKKYWFFFRVNPHSVQGLSSLLLANWTGNQTIPHPTVDFLSFFRIVSEGETNWNSFTLQRIHKAGLAIKDGQTHPLDPPPEEKDVSSLNARDKRKMQAEVKALKDQLSEIGKKKRIAAISRVGNFHRKTLLVDDGSLEAGLSAAVDTHGAEILNDPAVATAICPPEPGCEGEITSSPRTKRKAPDSDNPSNERLKTVRLSSPPRVSSPLRSVSPSSEPFNSELPLPGDRVISEEIDEPRPEAPLSQGLSVRTQNPLPASISGKSFSSKRHVKKNTALFEEANQEIELLTRNRAHDIAEAEHNAGEEMRGFGMQLIQSVTKLFKDEEVWTKFLTDRAELKSNFDLIKELESGRFLFENERSEVAAELAMVESELSSASRPTLDLKQFSLVFGDSPSQFEVGEGSRPHEGSPEV